MTTTPEKVAAILKTLPIGYYLGSRADVVLDTTSPTSFVNMLAKEIHVAFANVAMYLSGLPDDSDPVVVEQAIRCSLYHETAHLMLTPEDIPIWSAEQRRDYNILEDERIETLLRNRFHGVNFRENVYRINGWTPSWRPTDFGQFLGWVCRLRQGPQYLRDELDRLIARHPTAKEAGPRLAVDYDGFIRLCRKEWNAQQQAEKQQPQQQQGQPQPMPQNGGSSAKQNTGGGTAGENPPPEENGGEGGAGEAEDDERKDGTGNPSPTSGSTESREDGKPSSEDSSETEGGEGRDSDGEDGDGGGSSASDESEGEEPQDRNGKGAGGEDEGSAGDAAESETEADEGGTGADSHDGASAGTEDGQTGEGDSDDPQNRGESDGQKSAAALADQSVNAPELTDGEWNEAKKRLDNALRRYVDKRVQSKAHAIVVKATNKAAARSGVSHTYAGRIHPRSVATRSDYRWWTKSGDDGVGKDRLHLRLWVDCSDSFRGNIGEVNKLISALLDTERQMPGKFSLSVIIMGNRVRVHDKKIPILANEGTRFPEAQAEEADRKTAKPGWRELNVVVWDGDCMYYPKEIPASAKAAWEERVRAASSEYDSACEEWRKETDDSPTRDATCKKVTEAYDKYCATKREINGLAARPLNNRNTVIVSDSSNKAPLDFGAPLARRKYIDHDYAKVFVDEVLHMLDAII